MLEREDAVRIKELAGMVTQIDGFSHQVPGTGSVNTGSYTGGCHLKNAVYIYSIDLFLHISYAKCCQNVPAFDSMRIKLYFWQISRQCLCQHFKTKA